MGEVLAAHLARWTVGESGLIFTNAIGFVPSYYEFWRASSEPRLTDEEWRAIVSEGTTPLRPQWTNSFLVSDHIADTPIVRQ